MDMVPHQIFVMALICIKVIVYISLNQLIFLANKINKYFYKHLSKIKLNKMAHFEFTDKALGYHRNRIIFAIGYVECQSNYI